MARISQLELEDEIFYLLLAAGFEPPVRQFKAVKGRRFRSDFAWPEWGIIVEIEGGVYVKGRHVQPQGYTNDVEKYNELILAGYTLIRATSEQARNGQLEQWLNRAFAMKKETLPIR